MGQLGLGTLVVLVDDPMAADERCSGAGWAGGIFHLFCYRVQGLGFF